MAKLPDTLGPRNVPTPQRRVWSVDNTAVAQAQRNIGRLTEQSGADMIQAADTREKDQEKDALLDAVRRDNEAQKQVNTLLYGDGTEANPGLYSAKGAQALNSNSVFAEKYKDIRTRAMEGVTNKTAMAALEKSLMSMETGTMGNIQRFVQEERKGYTTDLTTARNGLAKDRVGNEYNNPETLQKSLIDVEQNVNAVAKIKGFLPGDDAYKALMASEKSSVYTTQLNALFNTNDPTNMVKAVKLFDQYKGAKNLTFEDTTRLENVVNAARPKVEAIEAFHKLPSVAASDPIGFVMQDLEGGDKYVPDGEGMAKFGINSAANPDIDVANLDETGARQTYKDRYWTANKIDELPQNMQLLAFDTAVNHRTDFKNEVLTAIKDGATPDDVFMMRLNEYERLAKANPGKYAKDLPGWKNRLQKLYERQYSPDNSNRVIDETVSNAVMANLAPEAQKEFKSLVDNNNNRIQANQMAERKTVVNQAMTSLMSGGVSSMPVELKAKAQELGVLKGLEEYTGATDPFTASFLYSLDPKALAETDIDDPAIRLKLSPSDYQRWTQKKEALKSSANQVAEATRKTLVKDAFEKRDINVTTTANTEAAQKARAQGIRLNEMLDLEIDAFASQNNGRYPNQAEMTKMVDGLFIKGDYKPWTFGEQFVFDVGVDSISKAERAQIEAALKQRGVPVTDAAIVKTYIQKNQ